MGGARVDGGNDRDGGGVGRDSGGGDGGGDGGGGDGGGDGGSRDDGGGNGLEDGGGIDVGAKGSLPGVGRTLTSRRRRGGQSATLAPTVQRAVATLYTQGRVT